jgi:hypothetical protein
MRRHLAPIAITLAVCLIVPIALVTPVPGPEGSPLPTRTETGSEQAAAHATVYAGVQPEHAVR